MPDGMPPSVHASVDPLLADIEDRTDGVNGLLQLTESSVDKNIHNPADDSHLSASANKSTDITKNHRMAPRSR